MSPVGIRFPIVAVCANVILADYHIYYVDHNLDGSLMSCRDDSNPLCVSPNGTTDQDDWLSFGNICMLNEYIWENPTTCKYPPVAGHFPFFREFSGAHNLFQLLVLLLLFTGIVLVIIGDHPCDILEEWFEEDDLESNHTAKEKAHHARDFFG